MGRLFAALGVVLLTMLSAAPASAEPVAPLGHAGRWITDADGRVVILHGLNMVYKKAPYTPSTTGFGADDAAFLHDNGFNTVRLGLIYAGVEPSPGAYDDAYLNDVASTEQTLAEHGIFSMLDYHQDLYSERFQGEGWPDWAVQDDGLPAQPQLGFPGNYVAMVALWRAFDHFWANDPGAGGVGLRDRYIAALAHVAARFSSAPHTIGYDLMNEPWAGTAWPSCTLPLVGCPLFEGGPLAAFSHAAAAAIRSQESQKLIWYEPNVLFDFGAGTAHPGLGDEQAGFSFHDYCLPAGVGLPLPVPGCELLEDNVLTNADNQAAKTGEALMLSEFGATDDLDVLGRMVDAADRHMVSWQEWHYCGCDDPTTQSGPGSTQALVIDPAQPPVGDNVKQAKLEVLSRPYPQAVAGTPESYGFDRAGGRFSLAYSTAKAGGGAFAPGAETEVFVPKLHYPGGYDVDVDGAGIASPAGAQLLRLVSCPGASEVSVAVSPAGAGGGNGPDCNAGSTGVAGAKDAIRGCAVKRFKAKNRHAKRKRRLRAAGC